MNQKLNMTPENPVLFDLLQTIMKEQCAFSFISLPLAKDYPTYYKIIKKPMCLSIMKDKALLQPTYSVDKLKEDMIQIVKNCVAFNRSKSQIVLYANQLFRKLEHLIENSAVLKDGNQDENHKLETKTESVKIETPLFQLKRSHTPPESRSRVNTIFNIISTSSKLRRLPPILLESGKVKTLERNKKEKAVVINLGEASMEVLEEIEREIEREEKSC